MQKHVRLLLVLSICFLITASVMLVNAAKANQQLPHESGNRFSVKTYTSPYSITAEMAFPKPTITLTTEFQTVEMGDLLPQGDPGDPVLPAKTLQLLIPMGNDVDDIRIYPGRRQLLAGTYTVEYGKTQVPVGHQSTAIDQPNPKIYASSTPFPGTLFTAVAEQHLRGYKILLLTLNPVQYVPKTGQLSYFESMTVTVNLKATTEVSPLLRNLPQDREIIRNTVDNPDALQTYYTPIGTRQQPSSIVDPAETYNYVIITNELLNASFQPLVNWKTLKGFNVTTVLVEDILADPDYFVDGLFGDQNTAVAKFNDTAARVRNFIKDAYANWETEYVLLGGDTAFIPTRGTYGFVNAEDPPNPYTFDVSIPCDMYFVALDGTWNNDNDTYFGEGVYPASSDSPQNGTAGDEADLYAELYIGRAPVTTPEQVDNFVSKTIWYENNTEDSYFKKALMFGETLDEDTEGANSKDLASDEIPQYTTKRYYSRDGTYNRNNVLNSINSGTHILNHDGHTNTETMLGLSRTDIDTYITNTEYFLGYSVGCYAAAIDADAVIEHFVKNPSGAFAFVGNSRYGWYMPGTNLGTGDQFDRKFFEILNDTQNILGKTLQASKEYFAGSISSDTVRWTYYELLILGDPSLQIVTEVSAPTAQFKTDPTASRLDPPVFRGVLTLNGTAKQGTAPGATFSNYTVDFGRGTAPTTWLTTGIELVDNGLNETTLGPLAAWDTTTILPGTVTLRLTSHDPNGTIGQDWWIVKVEELPAIRVEPSLVQTQEGLSFTVSVRITKPIDLWSFNFNMSWNPSLVEYVSHSVYVPQNTYYWGVLFSPATVTHDTVDAPAGTYWVAASSSGLAEPYNRDGTVFNMTFHAIGAGTCYLDIPSSELKNKAGGQITHVRWVSTVEVGAGVHDVAVKAITPLGTLIGQGYQTKINVTIANEGTFAESFNCTVYANGTAIANFTVIALAGLAEAQYTATWTTTGWDFGDYSISANATALDGETDLLDNSLTEGWISVTLPGDVEGDGDVDIFDIVKIANAYGSKLGQPKYDANCDVDKDSDVDIFDVVLAANNYGRIL